ncbi:MAG: M48 family metallopeptidase [Anaerolineaceae bacterium]|nr:M48 family metallopeptidase [Anaerolineaceae bacterium]
MENSNNIEKLDPQRQEKAKAYARISRRLMLVDLFLGGLYLIAWLVFGWSSNLKGALLAWTSNDWLLVAGFGLVFGLIYFIIGLPMSYYSGYHLPHRFEQSNESFRGWVTDQVKGIMVAGLLGGVVLESIYAILRAAPETWWLWAAGFLLLFNVLLANLAPVLLFPIFYKFKPLEEHGELAERLIRLAKRTNTKVQGVFQFDMSRRTKSANAGLTGLGNTRRIILGDTLLDEFSPDEIETVLAHEIGHHAHKDIVWGIAIGTVSTLVGFYLVSLGLNWGVGYFGFENAADIAAFPLFGIILGLFGLLTMPLDNAYSRWRERLADRYALEMTDNGAAFTSAMTRLANQNLSEVDPEPWVEFLLHSHPALGKRISMAEEFEK